MLGNRYIPTLSVVRFEKYENKLDRFFHTELILNERSDCVLSLLKLSSNDDAIIPMQQRGILRQ